MNHQACGCCEGLEVLTPADRVNRPGLAALQYRVGTHSSFFETMLSLLSVTQPGQKNPLAPLTARDTNDFSIALLDAWAVAGDVLTFYQERIANEGYLGTSIERRSVLELAKLIGYRLRPGIAASGFLAFQLQKDAVSVITAGTAARSVPAPGELPQTFETSQTIQARAAWNQLLPRPTHPQSILLGNVMSLPVVWLAGTSTKLKPNDLLLFDFDSQQRVRRVSSITEDHDNKRTQVFLEEEAFTAAAFARRVQEAVAAIGPLPVGLPEKATLDSVLGGLRTLPSTLSIADLDQKVQDAEATLSQLQITKLTDLLTSVDAHRQALIAKGKEHGGKLATAVRTASAAYRPIATTIDGAYKAILEAVSDSEPQSGFADLLKLLNDKLALVLDTQADALQLAAWKNFKLGLSTVRDAQAAALPPKVKVVQAALQTLKTNGKAGADDALKAITKVVTGFDTISFAGGLGVWDDVQDDLDDVVSDAGTDGGVTAQIKAVRQNFADFFKALKTAATGAQFEVLGTTAQELKKLDFPADPTLAIAAAVSEVAGFVHDYSPSLEAGLRAAIAAEQTSAQGEIAALVTSFLATLPATSPTDQTSLALLVKTIQDAEQPLNPAPADLIALATALDKTVASLDPSQTGQGLPSAADLKKLSDAIASVLDKLQGVTLGTETEAGFRPAFAGEVADVFSNFAARLQPTFAPAIALLNDLKTAWSAGVSPDKRPIGASVQILSDAIDTLKKSGPDVLSKTTSTQERSRISDWITALGNELDALRTSVNAKVDVPQPQTVDLASLPVILGSGTAVSPITATIGQNVGKSFGPDSDAVLRTLIALKPELGVTLYAGLRNLRAPAKAPGVFAMRVKANLFGFNAPQRTQLERTIANPEVTISRPIGDYPVVQKVNNAWLSHEEPDAIHLESSYDLVAANSWVVLDTPKVAMQVAIPPIEGPAISAPQTFTLSLGGRTIYRAAAVATAGRAEYGISGKSTRIALRQPDGGVAKWVNVDATDLETYRTGIPAASSEGFSAISSQVVRQTVAYVQSEAIDLAEAPIEAPLGSCVSPPNEIELDGVYDGLEAGRWIIVSGQRTDAPVPSQEVALLAGIRHILTPTLPGDSAHTVLSLSAPLQRCYERTSVIVYGNVAQATHGETQKQVLGSGDGSAASQTFALSRSPLTYLSADTPSGIQTTLQVRVNDVLWHEVDSTCGHGPAERVYTTQQDDKAVTTVEFGDGVEGSRLPSGVENVRAVYRAGLGKGGNLKAGQLSILSAPPLGVTSVSNPLPTSGGANAETRDQARRNAPLAVLALDRLVSLRDYADFARTYAGIAKARAAKVIGGIGQVVEVTIAGVDDIPILPGSELLVNLGKSLRDFGDPQQSVQVRTRELLLLVIAADVALDPDYAWEFVEPKIRAALLNAFSFDNRELGQDVLLSEVVAALQVVPGVVYSEVNVLNSISETLDISQLANTIGSFGVQSPLPVGAHQIAYLTPNVAESLILNPITGELGV